MLSFGGRGGRSMTFVSAGSTPRASPGRPSVTRLIQRIWTGSSGSGQPEERAEEHHPDLAGVGGEGVADEAADVVVDPATLADGGHDRGEVVVGEDHVGGFFGDLGSGHAHRDTDVGRSAAPGRR